MVSVERPKKLRAFIYIVFRKNIYIDPFYPKQCAGTCGFFSLCLVALRAKPQRLPASLHIQLSKRYPFRKVTSYAVYNSIPATSAPQLNLT